MDYFSVEAFIDNGSYLVALKYHMDRQPRQSQKKSKLEQLDKVLWLLNAGKTQAEAAAAAGINVRTVQRWLREPEVKAKRMELQQQTHTIVKSDPVVLSGTEVRQQVSEITLDAIERIPNAIPIPKIHLSQLDPESNMAKFFDALARGDRPECLRLLAQEYLALPDRRRFRVSSLRGARAIGSFRRK